MSAMRIATYTITAGTFPEVLDIATAPGGVAGIYQNLPGFVHFAVVDLGDQMFSSVTTWESRAQAEVADAAAAAWVDEVLSARIELASHQVGNVAYEA